MARFLLNQSACTTNDLINLINRRKKLKLIKSTNNFHSQKWCTVTKHTKL